jgi:nucleoid-associated protein YgaU
MERVTFLVERTGDRIPCLLNPEALEVRRSAGIVRRRGAGGAIIGNPRTDDPLVATGGGVTEYELKLLFDVDVLAAQSGSGVLAPAAAVVPAPADSVLAGLAGGEEGADGAEAVPPTEQPAPLTPAPNPPTIDVRTLTQPLWSLAENGEPVAGLLAPQRIRFIWGCSWNVPGVIVSVAERLECFDSQGVPKRSWLSMLLRRVEEELEGGSAPPAPTSPQFEVNSPDTATADSGDDSVVVPVDDEGVALTPLHVIAAERYGDPRYNRAIAEYNDLDDLLELEEGQPIRLPPASAVTGAN